MLYMLLLSLACALAVFAAAYGAATLALNRLYLSPDAVASRQAGYYADFAGFVSANEVSGRDSVAVTRFNNQRDYVTVTVFSPEDLGLDPRSTAGRGVRPQYSAVYGKLYPMQFADGSFYVRIEDNTSVREDNLNRIIAILLGSIAFVAVMFSYIRRLTSRIIRLSREAGVIGGGDLKAPISAEGEDELSQLAGCEAIEVRNGILADKREVTRLDQVALHLVSTQRIGTVEHHELLAVLGTGFHAHAHGGIEGVAAAANVLDVID